MSSLRTGDGLSADGDGQVTHHSDIGFASIGGGGIHSSAYFMTTGLHTCKCLLLCPLPFRTLSGFPYTEPFRHGFPAMMVRASGEAATMVQDAVEKQGFADCTDRGTTAAVGGFRPFRSDEQRRGSAAETGHSSSLSRRSALVVRTLPNSFFTN
jgi:hypothetical protein